MSKEKLENDYQNLNKQIDERAEEAIKNIREKADSIREEAKKIGETIEGSLNKGEVKNAKKKVNSR
jgi:F0F1-type ATP synthase membrane subunit b/b'